MADLIERLRKYAPVATRPTAAAVMDEAADRIIALEADNARLREGLERLRKSAAMLQQHAEGCAVNHYGQDFAVHGMPGWLADTKADIERAATLKNKDTTNG